MNDRVAQAAGRLDTVAVPLARRRLETLGPDGSGAYNFYAERLARGTIFSDYDLALARALLAWRGAPRRAHEIGGGFANLSLLLTVLGFDTVCLEFDLRRFDAACALLRDLAGAFPGIEGRCRLVNQRFPLPPYDPPPAGAVALITNLVATTEPEAKAAMLEALKTYRWAIIDIDHFLIVRRTDDERGACLAELASAGLVGAPFLAVKGSAHFHRFAGRAPRFGWPWGRG